ncbi:hypothetical protein VFPFJ_11593 [Purpureocillium lilacinum]|uniref:Uncharacterized protein n=1 Tax=Purpureocillium lilacinum TaxID=33203 RepID=A0A179F1F6_PURLI|nr:hypothetical protein VFPFJ_11593 [Purpureocillium lilacinum]OAQ59295.1 hypothetical protein VFPFJ_11593 [Purpureocillium lilacinum]
MGGHAAAHLQAPRTSQGNKGYIPQPKEAPLPTVSITPLADTKPERGALDSIPVTMGCVIRLTRGGGNQQRPPKRVRFLEPPTRRSHPDSTGPAEARAQCYAENQHHRPGAAAPPQSLRSTGQAPLHIAEVQHLSRVCASQGILHSHAGVEDAKIWNGIKYERRTTGPFVGRFASRGAIINIDGEDYVEYRVLTKPSFL